LYCEYDGGQFTCLRRERGRQVPKTAVDCR
jgi:hypothetical protein